MMIEGGTSTRNEVSDYYDRRGVTTPDLHCCIVACERVWDTVIGADGGVIGQPSSHEQFTQWEYRHH